MVQTLERDVRETWVRDALSTRGIDPLTDGRGVRQVVEEALERFPGQSSDADREDEVRSLLAEVVGFGPLQQFLDDPGVEEVWVNDTTRSDLAARFRA
ncbi:hypothetical protein [Actinomyces sp.]|uniref:hypothetical protein n=1 Tax=Actinomyces sp. TaxID=29317 RepID=UPI00289A471D|nr:hypothetical protein [Actinomyces sp.]